MAMTKMFSIKRGFHLPISGEPVQEIHPGPVITRVALLADDYRGMRPTMAVSEGDAVKRGQLLFEDKKNPGVRFTSPGAGIVRAINRGERRAFQSIVIELNQREQSGNTVPDDHVAFDNFTGKNIAGLSRDDICALLLESGLWSTLRARPFGRTPAPASTPRAIFVTAIDTNPLAPAIEQVLHGREDDFECGLIAMAKLTDGPVYFCKAKGSPVNCNPNIGVITAEFDGPHPAGLPGLHIHFLEPVSRERVVWHIGCQDVADIGLLLRTGHLSVDRIISLSGPQTLKPRLLRTRIGASTDELTAGELENEENRVISGSIWSGRTSTGPVMGYLGRYHQQISVLREDREREFLGWMHPISKRFSMTRLFHSRFFKNHRFDITTSSHGSERAMVPIGLYEHVMPMDLMPTHLLRALAARDLEKSEQLGCLELEEEDLALCSFVCPGKVDWGSNLRAVLDMMEKEG